MNPIRLTQAVALAALPLLGGCKLEPETPELRYSLNETLLESSGYEDYAGDPVAQDKLRGLLEMLVGTPSNPGFFLTEEMLDQDFDPNYMGGDLTDSQLDAMVEDNGRRFADALALIEAGEFGRVLLPREAVDMRRWWKADMSRLQEARAELMAEGSAGDGDAPVSQEDVDALVVEFQEVWQDTLVNYYPTLRESAEMFRTQCMHCHGVSGGGDGTTAPYLNPFPRDYRKGIFKFTSVADKARPTRDDLFRTLTEGIYTTSMPSFRRFSDAQLHGLVDYVRLLSIRGRVEELVPLDYDVETGISHESVFSYYEDEWGEWQEAPEKVIAYEGEVPRATPEMIARGKKLFFDEATANCASCHGKDHRGTGLSSKKQDPETGEMIQITDDWGNDIFPRDMNLGVFRFGRRPIDLFRRVHAGINGTPMPAQTSLTDPEGNRLLSDEDFWSIVHYVRSISAHEMVRPVSEEGGGH